MRERDLGTFSAPSPVGQHLSKWLEAAARPRVTERTCGNCGTLIDRYVKTSPLAVMKPSDLRAPHAQKPYSDLQERGLSARTVRYPQAVLNSAFMQAARWGMLPRNPIELVSPPNQTRKEMQALSAKEAGQFLKAAAEDRWGIIFSFALTTGMRPEEYLGLQ